MKISNKLYSTLMQYLMTISYQSFVPYVRQTILSPYGICRPSVSVVCDVFAPYAEG